MLENEYAVRSATVWHRPFYDLLTEGAPPTIEVRTEIILSQPHRANLLLLRRKDVPPRDHEARVLRGLWPLLGPVTLAELKGPSSSFQPGDLLRLVRYGLQYHELNMQALPGPSALTLALFMPAPTPSLAAAIEHMESWRLESLVVVMRASSEPVTRSSSPSSTRCARPSETITCACSVATSNRAARPCAG